jgi:hypothetical protein
MKPLLVVMTSNKNYEWCIKAFLKATSLWADYIIVADQMSTDGCRKICKQYHKVILIDNDGADFDESYRHKLLVDRARQINGDKILFGLDIDEIISANYVNSNDWNLIVNSVPGDVFWIRWAIISKDKKEYADSMFYPVVFHDDGTTPFGNYTRKIHSMRIPYPIEEKQMFYLDEIKLLHLNRLNPVKVIDKQRMLMITHWEYFGGSTLSINRTYKFRKSENKSEFKKIPSSWIYSSPDYNFNLFDEVSKNTRDNYYEYIIEKIKNLDIKKLRWLAIWDNEFLKNNNLSDPRKFHHKMFHNYLEISAKYCNSLLIRAFDKMFKTIGL